jgi:succinate dehydrogenase / fumarate reductase, cytochrome b subunit
MYSLITAFQNSVGRKILTGVTGIGLTLFLITHLSANLTLFALDPTSLASGDNAFNRYALFLKDLGWLLYIVEFGLLAIFLIHAYLGVAIYLRKRKARPEAYAKYKSRGGPSKQGFSSRTMIITGTILFLFVGMHLKTFKFGPGWNEEPAYTVMVESNGTEVPMRDLSKLTVEIFQSEVYVGVYMAIMLLLGFHLRHGVWSALQSLGANNKALTPFLYSVAGLVGILIALGFFILPIYLYFMFK